MTEIPAPRPSQVDRDTLKNNLINLGIRLPKRFMTKDRPRDKAVHLIGNLVPALVHELLLDYSVIGLPISGQDLETLSKKIPDINFSNNLLTRTRKTKPQDEQSISETNEPADKNHYQPPESMKKCTPLSNKEIYQRETQLKKFLLTQHSYGFIIEHIGNWLTDRLNQILPKPYFLLSDFVQPPQLTSNTRKPGFAGSYALSELFKLESNLGTKFYEAINLLKDIDIPDYNRILSPLFNPFLAEIQIKLSQYDNPEDLAQYTLNFVRRKKTTKYFSS